MASSSPSARWLRAQQSTDKAEAKAAEAVVAKTVSAKAAAVAGDAPWALFPSPGTIAPRDDSDDVPGQGQAQVQIRARGGAAAAADPSEIFPGRSSPLTLRVLEFFGQGRESFADRPDYGGESGAGEGLRRGGSRTRGRHKATRSHKSDTSALQPSPVGGTIMHLFDVNIRGAAGIQGGGLLKGKPSCYAKIILACLPQEARDDMHDRIMYPVPKEWTCAEWCRSTRTDRDRSDPAWNAHLSFSLNAVGGERVWDEATNEWSGGIQVEDKVSSYAPSAPFSTSASMSAADGTSSPESLADCAALPSKEGEGKGEGKGEDGEQGEVQGAGAKREGEGRCRG